MSDSDTKESLLLLTELPGDIFDHIALFLSDGDMGRFLQSSRRISLSPPLWQKRKEAEEAKQAWWKRIGLHELARVGSLPGVQYLHRIGTVITPQAMYYAAADGHVAVVQFLHSVGAVLTVQALEVSAKHGHLAVLQFFYSMGARITIDSMKWAISYGHLGVVQTFVPFLSHDKKALEQCMKTAVLHQHMAMVQYLHSVAAPIEINALEECARCGNLAMVEFLYNVGVPVTADPLIWAAYYGHLLVVQFLHRVGAPITAAAKIYAARNGHQAVVAFLEKSQAKNVDSFVL
jgi:hypothetical protein